MIDRFSDLLNQLGKIFELPLHIDKSNACSILIPPIIIQLQLDSAQQNLFLFSKIIEVPPGKFRENVLREALKANSLPDPKAAIFGYIASTNHLALHQRYPLEILNGERLAGLFGAFYEIGEMWHRAIQSGQTAPVPSGQNAPFGLKP